MIHPGATRWLTSGTSLIRGTSEVPLSRQTRRVGMPDVMKARNARKSYGMTVMAYRREVDLRRLPAPPRATKKFERMYKGADGT